MTDDKQHHRPKRRKRRVCLFGLSADPPTGHGGHLGIVAHLASMEMFDEVRVIPVYRHMFASKRGKQAPFQSRIQMCQLLFKDIPNVIVSEAERICFERVSDGLDEEHKESVRVGTADLLTMLITDEPNLEFTLALGADTFIDLVNGKWRRSEDVLQLVEYRIVVFRRLVEEDNASSEELKQHDEVKECIAKLQQRVDSTTATTTITVTQIPSATKSDIGVSVSSSAARNTTDETVLREILSADVLDYIRERKMYAFSDFR